MRVCFKIVDFMFLVSSNVLLFKAVTLFCGATSFESKLFNILSLLCTDRDVTVRKFIASGFHEVGWSCKFRLVDRDRPTLKTTIFLFRS